jgi:pimeloyl-ACP methyl ester carboxylesterase
VALKKVCLAIIFGCLIMLLGCTGAGTAKIGSMNHKATILYFEGGGGQVYPSSVNKLIGRSRYYLENHGFKLTFMDLNFLSSARGAGPRYTEKHYRDIQKRVNQLAKNGYPRIWLMGISNGAYSVLYAGINQIQGVEGLIVINSGQYLLWGNLKKIELPILAITHEEDGGPLKDLSDDDYRRYFSSSINPQIVVFSGGHTGTSRQAIQAGQRYQHGLRGLEKEFAHTVIDFIDFYGGATSADKMNSP